MSANDHEELCLCPWTQRLRGELDASGIKWYDDSLEISYGDYCCHEEKTNIMIGDDVIVECFLGYVLYGEKANQRTVEEIMRIVKGEQGMIR